MSYARPRRGISFLALLGGLMLGTASEEAQAQQEEPASLPPVLVTARRSEELLQKAPVSVTALTAQDIEDAGVGSIKQAAQFSPNVNVIEFTARAISNPQVRGVGGSPTNPGVTTYIDGVPQLNGDTSSIELIDVGQIEFVRGAQGSLYGRNTLGGVINIHSIRTDDDAIHAQAVQGLGSYLQRDTRLSLTGPLVGNELSASLAAGRVARDGYSVNQFTGNRLDSRAAVFGKGQLRYAPSAAWQGRLILVAESAHDGDFALTDLDQLRPMPHSVNHDFEGYTNRRINGQTVHVDYAGDAIQAQSITGYYRYQAFETTDLDVSPRNNLTRENQREGAQFTQEFRLESVQVTSFSWSKDLSLRWQAGVFGFRQSNVQHVVNFIAQKFLLANAGSFFPTPVPLPVLPQLDLLDGLAPAEDRTAAALKDSGAGIYGQFRFEYAQDWEAALGLRYDAENKHAEIDAETVVPQAGGDIAVSGPTMVRQSKRDAAVSPRGSLSYQLSEQSLLYGSVSKGFRAGGYNAVAPAGKSAYSEERSISYEIGAKSRWLDSRMSASLAVFLIRLDNLQLNIPDPGTPGRFYIDNAGNARNQGVELELAARPVRNLDLFASAGYLSARFGSGSTDLGIDASGRRVPFASPLTLSAGAQQRWRVTAGTQLSLRGEYQRFGDYYYTAENSVRQPAINLVNLRAALQGEHWRIEAWTRNLFDRDYIPLAIPFTGIAPSGYVGESAPPRTMGLNLSVDV